MLQAIRTRAGSIIVKTLFALLILSFGFWGIYTRSPFFQDNTTTASIATVGDQTIQVGDLQHVLQPAVERLQSQLGTTISHAQLKQLGVLDSLLNGLIDRSLIDQEAARLQLDVSDQVIRDAIAGNPAFRDKDGRFDPQLFSQILAMNNLTEAQFVTQMRTDVPRSDILHAITSAVTASKEVVDTIYRYRGETRVADIVAVPLSGAADPGQPSDAALQKFYDAHHELFGAPEYRGFTLVSLTAADLAASTHISEDALKKAYEERKGDFAVPEQRDVEQILAPSEEVAKQAEAALAAGKDWKEVATTIAKQDTGTIDLGLMKESELPGGLAKVAFTLPLNKPSEPIKSPLGWHILRVTKIVPASTETFAQAKPKLEARLQKEQAVDKLDKIGNKADDALAGGATLAEIASKFGLKTTTVAATDVGGRDPSGKPITLPTSPNDVLKALFSTDQEQISRIIDTEDGAIFAVRTDKVIEPHVRPLAEVKARAIAAWQQDQKRASIAKEAAALAAAVSPSSPLKTVAADKKLSVKTSPPLPRRAVQDGPAPPALVAKLFAAKKGAAVTAEDASGAYVAQLTAINDPGPPTPAVAKQLSQDLAAAERLDISAEFTDALRQRFPVKIDRAAVDRAF
ncbi:MAG TPA: SurA N-terminal domain-containing protein [Stellaceae bacterium]|nr:SurA N-terminal domain-containing protein [Stellaceae bacterium]